MTIVIVDYRPEWPDEFQAIAQRMRAALGEMALRIDHIGSTSVPGLAAKDVIDIQITVDGFSEQLDQRLTALGYTHLPEVTCDHVPPGDAGPPEEWQKWYFRGPGGRRKQNTHVRLAGRKNQRYALLFRDFLRTHPDTTTAYARLKRGLAAHLLTIDTYADVKDPAVDLIILAAESWALATNWQPGPTDA
ncbi:GrpB family protein [bacterium]|nr:GrpB family protein [bacterium]